MHESFSPSRWIVLVHGGAGDLAAERAPHHAAGCALAAEAGAAILRAGGSAVDAVEAAVRALEDDPKFNAGTGACLAEDGTIELDASIMEGGSLRAGAVAAMPPFRNPIAIARAAMEDGKHVMYAGEGAARFAEGRGFARSSTEAMATEAARARWREVREGKAEGGWAGGTVGAVARDASGRLAAATSTGGMVDKRAGRVGDAPVLGAGTYADDTSGAVSTTGAGESFLRFAYARTLVARLGSDGARRGVGLEAEALLEAMRVRVGGLGGAIAIDAEGRAGFARTTKTMSWGLVRLPDDADASGTAREESRSGA